MLGIGELDLEGVDRAVPGRLAPGAADQLLELRPFEELAPPACTTTKPCPLRTNSRKSLRVCSGHSFTPPPRDAEVVPIAHDAVEVGEGRRSALLRVLGHLDGEAGRCVEDLLQGRRGLAPIVIVLAAEDQYAELGRRITGRNGRPREKKCDSSEQGNLKSVHRLSFLWSAGIYSRFPPAAERLWFFAQTVNVPTDPASVER